MGIINFAHGVFYMLGAYAGWLTVQLTGSFWLALRGRARSRSAWSAPSSSAACSSASTGPRTRTSPGVLVTYGLAIMIPDLVRMTFGRPGKPFAVPEVL